MRWNYTKTAALILIGTLAAKIAIRYSGYYDRFRDGDPLAVILAAAIALLPIMVIADLVAARRSRREGRRE